MKLMNYYEQNRPTSYNWNGPAAWNAPASSASRPRRRTERESRFYLTMSRGASGGLPTSDSEWRNSTKRANSTPITCTGMSW